MAGHSNNSIWDSWFIGAILVILGLLNLGLQIARIDRNKSRETFNFPRKGKGKNSTTGKQTRKGTGTVDKSSHKKATWKKVVRLTLDIITLGVICVFSDWVHVVSCKIQRLSVPKLAYR